MTKRLTNEELTQIAERAEKATEGNPLKDFNTLTNMYDSLDDIPKLLSEIEELRQEVEMCEDIIDSKEEQLSDMFEMWMEAMENAEN